MIKKVNLNKNLHAIFQSNYIVPLYQRNYAWEEDEITLLLQDLYENFRKSDRNDPLKYFIGSLVVLKRKDSFYEVIDGQQRLTTLSILLRIMDLAKEPKLFYESRPEVEAFFASFYHHKSTNAITFDYKVSHLVNAVDIINQAIVNPHEKQPKRLSEIEEIEEFKKFIVEDVIIVRVEIPQDTDVAAYFEIMNNRGEQLQKHEILKAYLMESLKDGNGNYYEKQQDEFSKIWDACSQMDTHIQKNFTASDRKIYFGENYNNINAVKFEEEEEEEENAKSLGFSINDALQGNEKKTKKNHIIDVDDSGSDQSIIDFPNFLMHVLKIKYGTCLLKQQVVDIPLNEKDLIDVYEGLKDKIDAVDFISDLLYYRTVFDRYVVKATDEDKDEDNYKWTLQKPYKYIYKTRNTSLKYKNTFRDSERIIKSISLLQVSFRNRKYKNWLQDVLAYFSDRKNFGIDPYRYMLLLDKWKLKYFDDNVSEEHYHEGVKTPHFLFNFIDYLFWVKDHEFRSDFKFTYRNSVEHHLPQSFKKQIDDDLLDKLGNLCLVSKSSNSKMNNEHPTGKAAKNGKYYKTNLPPKQKKMYDLTNSELAWGKSQIDQHSDEVVNLLKLRESILIPGEISAAVQSLII